MIELLHVEKRYPNATPLKDVCAEIQDGEVIAVIGPSGTGKSTLLRCINRLETPTAGKIIVDGEDITAPGCSLSAVRRKMGMVFRSGLATGPTAIRMNSQEVRNSVRRLHGLSQWIPR